MRKKPTVGLLEEYNFAIAKAEFAVGRVLRVLSSKPDVQKAMSSSSTFVGRNVQFAEGSREDTDIGSSVVSGSVAFSEKSSVLNSTLKGPCLRISSSEIHNSAVVAGPPSLWVLNSHLNYATMYGTAHIANSSIRGRMGQNPLLYFPTDCQSNLEGLDVEGPAFITGALTLKNATIRGKAFISEDSHVLTIGPSLTSGRYLTAHRDAYLGVRVNTGCFSDGLGVFLNAVVETHKEGSAGRRQYLRWFRFIEEWAMDNQFIVKD